MAQPHDGQIEKKIVKELKGFFHKITDGYIENKFVKEPTSFAYNLSSGYSGGQIEIKSKTYLPGKL